MSFDKLYLEVNYITFIVYLNWCFVAVCHDCVLTIQEYVTKDDEDLPHDASSVMDRNATTLFLTEIFRGKPWIGPSIHFSLPVVPTCIVPIPYVLYQSHMYCTSPTCTVPVPHVLY